MLTLRRSAHVTAPILGSASEKAEAVLKAYDYSDIELQADPNGWSGTAVPTSGGYRLNVTIDRSGVMQLKP